MAACLAPAPSSSSSGHRQRAGSPRGAPCGTPAPAAPSPPSGSGRMEKPAGTPASRHSGSSPWPGDSGMSPSHRRQRAVTRGVPWHSTHQLGVGRSSEGEGFPQEDPVAPHVRLGGEFLRWQEEGRLKPAGGHAGPPSLPEGKTGDSACPLPPPAPRGANPPLPSHHPHSPGSTLLHPAGAAPIPATHHGKGWSGQSPNFGRRSAECARSHHKTGMGRWEGGQGRGTQGE